MTSRSGFGLVETMISLVFVALILLGVSFRSSMAARGSRDFASMTSCQRLTDGIATTLKAYDNVLKVRNWLPKNSTSFIAASNPMDSYCNGVMGRTPVCDTVKLFSYLGVTSYVDPNNYRTYQNVRGAFTWAQSVYNTYRSRGICSADGVSLTADQLRNLLPNQVDTPREFFEYRLHIRDSTVRCGDQSTSQKAKFDVIVSARFKNVASGKGEIETCKTAINLIHQRDNIPPVLTLVSVNNGIPSPIPNNSCTDTRRLDEVAAAGGPGTSWQNIRFALNSNEPGSALLCRKASSFEADPPGMFRSCTDLPLDFPRRMAIDPHEGETSYNLELDVQLDLLDMPDLGGKSNPASLHTYEFKAVDVGGNESQVVSHSFHVHTPRCIIPPSDYCPNAVDNWLPPLWDPRVSSGPNPISIRPFDDCENGVCPTGTHSICDLSIAPSVCAGTFYEDDCGLPVCRGTMPPSCAGVVASAVDCGLPIIGVCGAVCPGVGTRPTCTGAPAPATVACGTPIVGGCGADCGVGTLGAVTATGPGAGLGPDGRACHCDAPLVDTSIVACCAAVPDSCGNVDACQGTMCGSPTPTPLPGFNWGPANFVVNQTSSPWLTRVYNLPIGTVPAGYSRYDVDIDVRGASDRRASRISVEAILTSGPNTQTFRQTGGPYYPIDSFVPFFSGTVSVAGGGPVTLVIRVSVTETSSTTTFRIRGIP